jgi:2-polyprenyl-3-methyl-5-hydroxy-6-metoxy-1,4-benzoquinol methylase
MNDWKCYLCGYTQFFERDGEVREAPTLKILQCTHCGLVTLSSLSHIQAGFYEESHMHGADVVSMENWLRDTDWDDQRRVDMLKPMLANKNILDFGCGAGGFLSKARYLSSSMVGIELERRVREFWANKIRIHSDLAEAGEGFDLITAFHVIEHLPDPVAMLKALAHKLSKNGRMVVEVPSSEDALLTLYASKEFQRFTYWSQHLFLFNTQTLKDLVERAGLRVASVQQYQRYPLSNHLHWLSQGKPGGHQKWSFLDNAELNHAYANALAALGKCDTLIAHLEHVS